MHTKCIIERMPILVAYKSAACALSVIVIIEFKFVRRVLNHDNTHTNTNTIIVVLAKGDNIFSHRVVLGRWLFNECI